MHLMARTATIGTTTKTSPQCRDAYLLSPNVSEFRFLV